MLVLNNVSSRLVSIQAYKNVSFFPTASWFYLLLTVARCVLFIYFKEIDSFLNYQKPDFNQLLVMEYASYQKAF